MQQRFWCAFKTNKNKRKIWIVGLFSGKHYGKKDTTTKLESIKALGCFKRISVTLSTLNSNFNFHQKGKQQQKQQMEAYLPECSHTHTYTCMLSVFVCAEKWTQMKKSFNSKYEWLCMIKCELFVGCMHVLFSVAFKVKLWIWLIGEGSRTERTEISKMHFEYICM